ncbi:MAG: RNA polymerase sigma factor [Phycisphaerae bacterium]|jgi:RNA polymerase sigma-70 factor (ECF subfamily)|nr:RNA polymerase sigma factor [Phycisphaerae bacterium]
MQMTSAGHHDRRPEPEKPTAAQKRALEEIIALHERWVRSVVLAVTGRPDEVDDVTQQVWMQMWRRRDQLESVTDLRKWLYTLARNAAIDAGRSTTRRRGLWRRFTSLWRHEQSESKRRPDRELISSERLNITMRAIESLGEKYRTVLVLRVWRDLSYTEIARTLDITPQAVETRLVRARRMLRAKLDPEERK